MVTYRAVTYVTSKFAFLEHIQSIYRQMVVKEINKHLPSPV